MKSKYTCKDCNLSFIGNTNLNIHLEICKKKELSKNNDEQEKIIKDQEKIIKDQETHHKKEILEMKDYNDKTIKEQEIRHKKETDYNEKIIKEQELKLREQETQYKKDILEIKDYNEKIIKNLQTQLDKMFSTIEKLIDKPTGTTTNVTNNNVRNIYSDKYFLDKLTPEELNKKCQNYLLLLIIRNMKFVQMPLFCRLVKKSVLLYHVFVIMKNYLLQVIVEFV
jgi:hypothetical protein